MELTGLHVLLTYRCTRECAHCFLFGSPRARAAFSSQSLDALLAAAGRLGTLREVYFEGGEPFLQFPLLLPGARRARSQGWDVGIVTNAYWATSEAAAERWLRPLAEIGVTDLSISRDGLHDNERQADTAVRVATRLGIPNGVIAIATGTPGAAPGEPVSGGDVMYKGRAALTLAPGAVKRHWSTFDRCPHEDLASPDRVHADAAGFLHLCQGLAVGNWLETALPELVRGYQPAAHPIAGPLLQGGPAALAAIFGLPAGEEYADACHLCYLVRRGLRSRYPAFLGPAEAYGG